MILWLHGAGSAAAHTAVAITWPKPSTQSPQPAEKKKLKKQKLLPLHASWQATRALLSPSLSLSQSLDKLVANVNVVGLKQKRRLVGQ